MRSSAPQISKVGAWISGSRFSSLALPSGQKARAAASLARTCSIGHSGELAPSGSVLSWFQRSGSAQIRAGTSGARCAHGSVIGSFSSNNPHGAISARRRTEPGQIAAISAANEPPTELPARSAPSSPAFCSRWRTASTQSRWLSSTVCPRSPPGKPGSDGTMTVRSRANASRNGIQRGNPPKPARKPSLGPAPFFQTRLEKPLSSTEDVSGSLTIIPQPYPSSPRRRGPRGDRHLSSRSWTPAFAGVTNRKWPSSLLCRHRRGLEWRQRCPRVAVHRLRPPTVFPVGEDIGQLRNDFVGKEFGVVLGEILAHVAELHQQHQMADIEVDRDFPELCCDLVWRADDHIALLDDRIHLARQGIKPAHSCDLSNLTDDSGALRRFAGI